MLGVRTLRLLLLRLLNDASCRCVRIARIYAGAFALTAPWCVCVHQAAELGDLATLRNLLGVSHQSQQRLAAAATGAGAESTEAAEAGTLRVHAPHPRHGASALHLVCGGPASDEDVVATIRLLVEHGARWPSARVVRMHADPACGNQAFTWMRQLAMARRRCTGLPAVASAQLSQSCSHWVPTPAL